MTEPIKISFRSQLKTWKIVCFALFLRELKSQFSDKLGLAWAFLEPFLFVFGLSYFRALMGGGDVHGMPVIVFMLIGMVLIQSFMQPLNSVASAFKKNKPLYAFRQVQPIAGLLVTAFIEYSIKVVVIVLAGIAFYLLGIELTIDNPLELFFLFNLMWFFTISLSCIIGICTAFVPEIKKMIGLFTRPVFFISCVFFSLQDIPQEYWPWLTWNPLVHIIELARYSVLESYGQNGVSLEYPLYIAIGLFFFAVCIYHMTWKGILSR